VDTASTTSPAFIGQVTAAYGAPQFVGRYLVFGGGTPLSQSEATSLVSQNLPILLLASPGNSDLTSASTAVTEANTAIARAAALGVPHGTALFRDIENNYQVNAAYITAWHDTIAASGYVPGFYENPLPGSSGFSNAYCAAVAGQPSVGTGSVLYSDQPELSGYTFVRSQMPAYAPSTPPCANTTIAWQYKESASAVNVDVDELPAQYAHYLWGGSSEPPSSTTTTTTAPPVQAPVTTTVTSSANPSSFGQPVTLTTTVAAQSPNPNTPTGAVQMFDGGTLIESGNLSGGTFSVTTSTLPVGTHPIRVTYAGDSHFLSGSSASLNQVVNKAVTTTNLTASPPGSTGFGHPVTFIATVSVPPPGAGTPTGTLALTADGTQVALEPLTASLTASVATSALSPGSHVIGASYSGDGNFLSSSTTLNYLVTCTVNVTGNHPGALIASGDSTCVVNATVGGAIIVPKGTSLAVINSTIGGSISAPNRANAIEVCGSRFIGGSITIMNAQGMVIVGDPGDVNCAGNTVGGTLVLRNNTHGVEAIGNTVGGLVSSGNSGPGPFPRDTSSVRGNHRPGQ
jgi:hypothetical protein